MSELDNILEKYRADLNNDNSFKIFANDERKEFSDYFIRLLDDKMVYLTGNISYDLPANDNLFNFRSNNNKNIIKLERFVEIFDPINEIWEPLLLRGIKKI